MKRRFPPYHRIAVITALALVGFAAVAASQTPAPAPSQPQQAATPWNRGTTLDLFGGATDASPNTNTTAGAAIGWEVNHFMEIEGLGAWFLKKNGAEAFAADMKLLFNLTRPARFVPFLGGGVGLYWQSFDPGSAMPSFYAQRLTAVPVVKAATFTDPTGLFVGGANLYLATHISIRPDVTLRLVTDGSDVYKVTTLSVSFTYHFEDHPKE